MEQSSSVQKLNRWYYRWALVITACAPIAAQLVGSAFNIWYNVTQIEPLLTEKQIEAFYRVVLYFNLIAYPMGVTVWLWFPISLSKSKRLAIPGTHDELSSSFQFAQRRAVNLPWTFGFCALVSWLCCIPVFLIALHRTGEDLNPSVVFHLPVSFIVASLIAVTHGFFAVEWSTQRLLFPIFFQQTQPHNVKGFPLSIGVRGGIWILSTVVCPIVSIILLVIVPIDSETRIWFICSVGVLSIFFALMTAAMLWRWLSEPIKLMRQASLDVSNGELETKIDLLRADEFGPMIFEFNQMVDGLREKERIHRTFGHHVGEKAAAQILKQNPSAKGDQHDVTILFMDVRDYTKRSSDSTPSEIVEILNVLFTHMVEVIESRSGMVNKFLGDGLMAVFGAIESRQNHSQLAVQAAVQMQIRMKRVNEELNQHINEPLQIGIGINSGPAVLGSIGAPQRRDYTVIGDTVNVAARVESLTKQMADSILITEGTSQALTNADLDFDVVKIESQSIKGKSEKLTLFAIRNFSNCNGEYDE